MHRHCGPHHFQPSLHINAPAEPAPNAAFSIVEVVIILVIVATLSAIAIPRYASAVTRYRAAAAARHVAITLKLAQDSARQASASRTVTFDTANHTCTLTAVQDLNTNTTSNMVISLQDEPFGATLVSADFGGDSVVIFNGYGIADTDGTVVIQIGSEQRTIQLDALTGKATVQ